MRISITITLFFASIQLLYSQRFEWAKKFGSINHEYANGIAADSFGDIFVIGAFAGTLDFDPDTGVVNLTSIGSTDGFLLKFNSDGQLIWAKKFGGTGSVYCKAIFIDHSNNVHLTGTFTASADFDPGPDTSLLASAGSADAFVCKLDANGNFLWAKRLGGPGVDIPYSLAADANGNVLIAGGFGNTADFDPDTGVFNMTSSGYDDVFVCKLNSSGAFVWAKRMGSNQADHARSLCVDLEGNVITTGVFTDTVDFNPLVSSYLLASNGLRDVFMCKLDSVGDFVWALGFGGANQDSGQSIACDQAGNLYLSGQFNGNIDFDPDTGVYNIPFVPWLGAGPGVFTSKFNPSGGFEWVRAINGSMDDFCYSMAVDDTGCCYVSGYCEAATYFQGIGLGAMNDIGFVYKLQSNGNLSWARCIAGNNVSYELRPYLCLDPVGNVYTT